MQEPADRVRRDVAVRVREHEGPALEDRDRVGSELRRISLLVAGLPRRPGVRIGVERVRTTHRRSARASGNGRNVQVAQTLLGLAHELLVAELSGSLQRLNEKLPRLALAELHVSGVRVLE